MVGLTGVEARLASRGAVRLVLCFKGYRHILSSGSALEIRTACTDRRIDLHAGFGGENGHLTLCGAANGRNGQIVATKRLLDLTIQDKIVVVADDAEPGILMVSAKRLLGAEVERRAGNVQSLAGGQKRFGIYMVRLIYVGLSVVAL